MIGSFPNILSINQGFSAVVLEFYFVQDQLPLSGNHFFHNFDLNTQITLYPRSSLAKTPLRTSLLQINPVSLAMGSGHNDRHGNKSSSSKHSKGGSKSGKSKSSEAPSMTGEYKYGCCECRRSSLLSPIYDTTCPNNECRHKICKYCPREKVPRPVNVSLYLLPSSTLFI